MLNRLANRSTVERHDFLMNSNSILCIRCGEPITDIDNALGMSHRSCFHAANPPTLASNVQDVVYSTYDPALTRDLVTRFLRTLPVKRQVQLVGEYNARVGELRKQREVKP